MYAGIYIRKDNVEKWEAIADKSVWINTLLENSSDTTSYGSVKESPVGPIVNVLSEELPPLLMACCKLLKPCKHWHFNFDNSTWTNELTGETKEVVT